MSIEITPADLISLVLYVLNTKHLDSRSQDSEIQLYQCAGINTSKHAGQAGFRTRQPFRRCR